MCKSVDLFPTLGVLNSVYLHVWLTWLICGGIWWLIWFRWNGKKVLTTLCTLCFFPTGIDKSTQYQPQTVVSVDLLKSFVQIEQIWELTETFFTC